MTAAFRRLGEMQRRLREVERQLAEIEALCVGEDPRNSKLETYRSK